jgi:hypothetical protein
MPTIQITATRRIYINGEVQPGQTVTVPARLGAALIALGRATAAGTGAPPDAGPPTPETATAAPDRRRK